MKKTFFRLILAIALIAVIIIVVIVALRPKLVAINNPVDVLNIKDARAQSYAAAKSPELASDDWIIGSKTVPLKIFVYEDYSNVYSATLADTLDKVKTEFKKQAAVIVRPYILKNSLSSSQAALAVDCAGEQGRWEEMRLTLFAQVKSQSTTLFDFYQYADQIGLNQNKFQTCLTNSQKLEKIGQWEKEAADYGILGAPTIFIGSEMILGARPYEDFVDSNGDKIEGLRTVIIRKLGETGK